MSTLSLKIQNNSAGNLVYFVCHSLVKQAGNELAPVWQTDELPSGGTRDIRWDSRDIEFMWSGIGQIAPGVQLEVDGTAPVRDSATAVLNRLDGDTYTLMPSSQDPPPSGMFQVSCTADVPPNRVAVGLTAGENAIVAYQAGPNLNISFMLPDKLAISRSNDVVPVGMLVTPEQLENAVEIDVKQGLNWIATYNRDESWTVTPAWTSREKT